MLTLFREFRIRANDDGSYIAWGGELNLTTDDILAAADDTEAPDRNDAKAFLREALKDGEQDSETVYQWAKKAGIAKRTLDRAKAELGVRSRKLGIGREAKWIFVPPAKLTEEGEQP